MAFKLVEALYVPVLAVEVPAVACNSSTTNKLLKPPVPLLLTRVVVEAGAVHDPAVEFDAKTLITYSLTYVVVNVLVVTVVDVVDTKVETVSVELTFLYADITLHTAVPVGERETDDSDTAANL
jgi:hypothetical protein